MIAQELPVEPEPAVAFLSTLTTLLPPFANSYAMAHPMMPAPMITASNLSVIFVPILLPRMNSR